MKYIFFDIDGTLVYSDKGKEVIPASTIKTIQKLQKKGHITAIASGRPLSMVTGVAQRLGIHYIVSDGGYGLMMNDEIIHIDPLDRDLVRRLSKELLEKKIPFAFLTDSNEQKVYATHEMLQGKENLAFESLEIVIDDQFDYQNEDAYKVFIALKRGDEDLLDTIDAHKIMRYFEGHLAFEPDDKYKGVKELVELNHGSVEDIIFFGDGQNDISMFEKIPFSIAMGNAIDELKKMAYFVTKDVDSDGIEYACQYFHLID